VRAFIFDMDGTLATTVTQHELARQTLPVELRLKVNHDQFFSSSATPVANVNDRALRLLFQPFQ